MGDQPSQLGVVPTRNVFIGNNPMANIMDFRPGINIRPFGKCRSLANPKVAAATAAHHGALTPMPCIPNTQTPWIAGKNDVDIQGMNGVLVTSCLNCVWNGLIKVVQHGQVGPGFVMTGAAKVTHESFSCEIPVIHLVHKKKKILLYDKEEKEMQYARIAGVNVSIEERIASLKNQLASIDSTDEKKLIDDAIIANECYGDKPKYIEKTNYVKVISADFGSDDPMLKVVEAIELANSTEKETGFHAELFYNELTNEYKIGFAGSGSQMADWIGNGMQASGLEFPQQILTNNIIKAINNLPIETQISLTGHSLGGALASYVGLATGRRTSTFNSEGVSDKILEVNGLLEKKNNHDYDIKAYYNKADILSTVQDTIPSSNYVASAIGDRIPLGNLNNNTDVLVSTAVGAVSTSFVGPVLGVAAGSATYGLLGHAMPKIVDRNLSKYDVTQTIWTNKKDKLNKLTKKK